MAHGSEYNPYQPPAFDEGPNPEPSPAGGIAFATRSERLGAAMIDSLIQAAVLFPIQIALGVYRGFPRVQPQAPLAHMMWGLGGLGVYLAIHGYLLAQRGQTIGKRLVGIRIVNVGDGAQTSIARIVGLRILPIQLVTLVPKVGIFAALVDAVIIFRKDRRCVHDHLAGTMVVKATRARG
jgi:uncharacterized RDD family membrane protein YckC